MSRFAHRAYPYLILFGLWLLFFWRYLIPGPDQVMFPDGDFTQQFFVFRDIAYRALAQGNFPLWANCFFAGYPFQADPQSQLFYPPIWISFLTLKLMGWGNFPLFALTVEATLHYFAASIFTFLFLRVELGHLQSETPKPLGTNLAALVGAVTFTYGGYLTSYPPLQTGILETVTWLPLILLAFSRLADPQHSNGKTLIRISICALLLAVAFFAGHPQTFLFVVYLSSAYFIFHAALHQRLWRWTIPVLVGVMVLLLGLSLVQLLPQAQYLSLSTRSALNYDQLADGFVLGVIVHILFADNTRSPLYAGILPFVLALLAIASVLRLRHTTTTVRRVVLFWGAVAVVGLLLSFGDNASGYPIAYWLVPGFRLFRQQERMAMVYSFAVSVLAALGAYFVLLQATRAHRVLLRRAAWLTLVLLPVAIAVLVIVSALRTAYPDLAGLATLPDRLTILVFGLGFTIVALYAALRFVPASRAGWVGGLFIGVAALELFTAYTPSNKVVVFDPYPYLPILDPIRADPDPFFRVQADGETMQGHFACGYGLAEWGGISPIRPASWQAFEDNAPEYLRWKLIGMKYLITWKNGAITREEELPAAEKVSEGPAPRGEAKVYRLFDIPRRAWLVYQYESVPTTTEVFDVIRAPSFDPFTSAVALAPAPLASDEGASAHAGDSIEIYVDRPGHLWFRLNVTTEAFLVVSEAYYPGWVATANGMPVPVLQTDGLMLGIPLPPGDLLDVKLDYRPVVFTLGAYLSFATVVLIMFLFVLGQPRSKST